MTLVKITLERPTSTGWGPARGSVLLSGNKRKNADHSVHLPDPFRVRLGDPFTGQIAEPGVAWAELEPSTADWVWKFDEKVQGGSIKYKRVPAEDHPDVIANGFIEYDDLVEVDPASLSVTGLPAQWVVEAEELRDQIALIEVGGVEDSVVAAIIAEPTNDSHAAVEAIVDTKTTIVPAPVLLFENALI